MKKNLRLIFSLLILTALLVLPYFVFAEQDSSSQTTAASSSALEKLTAVATSGGYQEGDLAKVTGRIISAALSLLGGVFIILIVIGGYNWMTAEGKEEKVERAQNYIRRAIIGLIITLGAWAIWTFMLTRFISS